MCKHPMSAENTNVFETRFEAAFALYLDRETAWPILKGVMEAKRVCGVLDCLRTCRWTLGQFEEKIAGSMSD